MLQTTMSGADVVLVYHDDKWSAVCADAYTWTDNEANAICTSKGNAI